MTDKNTMEEHEAPVEPSAVAEDSADKTVVLPNATELEPENIVEAVSADIEQRKREKVKWYDTTPDNDIEYPNATEPEPENIVEAVSADVEQRKREKVKWYDTTPENDIKYRGPISSRHLKILGWLCIIFSELVAILNLGMRLDPTTVEGLKAPSMLFGFFAPLSVPFLLFATFGTLLTKKDFKKPLLLYGSAALIVILVFFLLYDRYFIGIFTAFTNDVNYSLRAADAIFAYVDKTGYVAFNIFIDLFLSTLTMYFLSYEPKKYFQGDKRIFFRLFAILPFIYELVGIYFKVRASSGYTLPINVMPFLPAKPPMMFVAFAIFVIYLELRQHRYIKAEHTKEEYEAYNETNRASFQFARFAAIALVITGILDLVIYVVVVAAQLPDTDISEVSSEAIQATANIFLNAGFGMSFYGLLLFAPFMLLYSYTRKVKDAWKDMIIPIVSMIVMVLLAFEALVIGIREVPGMIGLSPETVRSVLDSFLEPPTAEETQDLQDEQTIAELFGGDTNNTGSTNANATDAAASSPAPADGSAEAAGTGEEIELSEEDISAMLENMSAEDMLFFLELMLASPDPDVQAAMGELSPEELAQLEAESGNSATAATTENAPANTNASATPAS